MAQRKLTKKETKALHAMACERLYLETLEEQKSDSLDFHEVAMWQLADVVERAYRMGLAARNKGADGATYATDDIRAWTHI